MKPKHKRYRSDKRFVYIDLNLKHINQLFDSRDPSPFLERDLDDNAVDYIVTSMREHPMRTPIALTIHITDTDTDSFKMESNTVVEAIHNHFAYDSELVRKKLRNVFRQAQLALLLGGTLLFSCLIISKTLENLNHIFVISVLREGLVIFGWVAMWRPINDFLYSWWPQLELRKIFTKLSEVPIEVKIAEKK